MTHAASLPGDAVVMAMPAACTACGGNGIARIAAGMARRRTCRRERLPARGRAAVPADLRKQPAGAG